MKVKNIFSFFLIFVSIICIFINIKVFKSNLYQAYLLYDYNNEKFMVPNEIYSEKLDDDFPNLTFTALPMKVLKARYYIELDSLKIAKSLLFQAMNDNPYLMASEEMLSRIYLEEQKFHTYLTDINCIMNNVFMHFSSCKYIKYIFVMYTFITNEQGF